MIALLALLSPAHAWEWDYNWTSSSSSTYHIRVQDFSSAEITDIVAGASAWNTGAGRPVRGSSHTFNRGTNASSLVGLFNTQNEVFTKPGSWFANRGLGNPIAAMIPVPRPGTPWIFEVDIVFNTGFTYCTLAPSNPSCNGVSIGQTATHEFGHAAGWGHESDVLATMNPFNPFGGDAGGVQFRISEDDAAGMMVKYPGSSTGINLMLVKFKWTGSGTSQEIWTSGQKSYSKANGWPLKLVWGWWIPDSPDNVNAMHIGPGTTTSLVEWRVTTGACIPGAGFLVGSRSPGMSTNTPFSIGPNSWNFSAVPNGTYRLCVSIDPNNTVGETSGLDNTVGSRSNFYIRVDP